MDTANLSANPLLVVIGIALLLFWGFVWGGFKLLPGVAG